MIHHIPSTGNSQWHSPPSHRAPDASPDETSTVDAPTPAPLPAAAGLPMIFINLALGPFTRAMILAHSAITSGPTTTGKPPRRLIRRRTPARLPLLPRP